jgi:hypothetical protein
MTHDELAQGYRSAWREGGHPDRDQEILTAMVAAFVAIIVLLLWAFPPVAGSVSPTDIALPPII